MAAMGQSINVSFMRPVTEGDAEVRARARHRGRTTWVWEAEVPTPRSALCALAQMTIAVRPTADGAPAYPPKRFVIGRRRSRPNAFGVIRIPGAAWRRLYSERSTIRMTSSTTSAGSPASIISSRPWSRST